MCVSGKTGNAIPQLWLLRHATFTPVFGLMYLLSSCPTYAICPCDETM